MSNIKNLLLGRLLNEWLDEWKEKAPSRFVEECGDGVPEHWCNGLEKKVSDDWLNQLLETQSAIQNLDTKEYYELARDLKTKYQWVKSINAINLWIPNKGTKQKNAPITISWEEFLRQLIEILLAKTHQQWDESEIDRLYPLITLKIEAVTDGLMPNVYKAEIHGKKQPQSWEEFLAQAIELLLAGKRHWNKEKYTRSEQIKSVVSSLVSAAYQQQLIVKKVYDIWADKSSFLSSRRLEYEEDNVQDTLLELEEIAQNVDGTQLENPDLDYLSGFNLGDDPELRWFAEQLPEFIVVKNPYKHRITVELKPDSEIAKGLGLDVKRVRELIKELKKYLTINNYKDCLE